MSHYLTSPPHVPQTSVRDVVSSGFLLCRSASNKKATNNGQCDVLLVPVMIIERKPVRVLSEI